MGDVNFTDGSPDLFWIYKPSPGLSMLRDYLQIIYGDRVGDGGGEGLGTGSPVLARYIADGRYYRARVQQVVVKKNNPRESMYSGRHSQREKRLHCNYSHQQGSFQNHKGEV